MTQNVNWDQSGFDCLLKSFSARRRRRDEAKLQDIFNQASGTARQALDWARDHGVRFFIDKTIKHGVAGYYTPGTGVVALVDDSAGHATYALSVLTHEIRHAWQDAHGLIAPPTLDFATYSIQNALIEADAYAFECCVSREQLYVGKDSLLAFIVLDDYRDIDAPWVDACREMQNAAPDMNGYMSREFMAWFSGSRAKIYGDAAACYYGDYLGFYKGGTPVRDYEFSSKYTGYPCNIGGELGIPLGDGVDITDPQRVLELGKTFTGDNYLTHLPPDFLTKTVLRPSLALTFYGAANDDQRQLATALHKHYLKNGQRRMTGATLGSAHARI